MEDTTADLPLDVVGEDIQGPLSPKNEAHEQNLTEHMYRLRKNPIEWAREMALFLSGTGWRGYRDTDVVGQRTFYPGYSETIKSAVLKSPLLLQRLSSLTEQRLEAEEKEHLLDVTSASYTMDRSRRRDEIAESLVQITTTMIDQMICKMNSKVLIRSAYYVITSMLTHAYHQGIHVSREEVLQLREVAAMTAQKKQSIIFLPSHKSHLDYISLQLICFRLGITLPVVVAGDNLNFPVVGPFLQGAGAMWIRRTFDNDPLYRTLVQAYLDTMLQKGYNLECFIEGTRSRTGKLLGPKFGILSFLLDSVLSGRVEDAYICPVSSQYDKVIEVDSYVNELMGQAKQKENLVDFLSASSVLSLKLGRVDVRFHKPWSLREFIEKQQLRSSHTTDAGSGTKEAAEVRIRMLRTLGYQVLSDINAVSVVMPTALVGTILLTLRGRGVGKSELIRRVEWLSQRIRENGGRVAHFHGAPTEYVVERALEVLGPTLVGRIDGLPEETYYAVDRFQLSFYRNMTIHLFVSEALIAIALYTKVKQGGGPSNQRISREDLTEKVSFLSQLFRGEFIFQAGEGLENNLQKAIQKLQDANVLQTTEEEGKTYIGLTDVERRKGRENYDFYCFLLWPFCEAAWLGAVSLLSLVPPPGRTDVWIDQKAAADSAQLLGRTLYHQGDLSYFEAINKEALKNAYARFQEEGIILVSKAKDIKAQQPAMRLAPDWTPSRNGETGELLAEGRLWDFTEHIAQCRREGKNRRDGATVSSRVFTLAATLGTALFERPKVQSAAAEDELSTEKVRRRSKL